MLEFFVGMECSDKCGMVELDRKIKLLAISTFLTSTVKERSFPYNYYLTHQILKFDRSDSSVFSTGFLMQAQDRNIY